MPEDAAERLRQQGPEAPPAPPPPAPAEPGAAGPTGGRARRDPLRVLAGEAEGGRRTVPAPAYHTAATHRDRDALRSSSSSRSASSPRPDRRWRVCARRAAVPRIAGSGRRCSSDLLAAGLVARRDLGRRRAAGRARAGARARTGSRQQEARSTSRWCQRPSSGLRLLLRRALMDHDLRVRQGRPLPRTAPPWRIIATPRTTASTEPGYRGRVATSGFTYCIAS
jgi:hypothetical protein